MYDYQIRKVFEDYSDFLGVFSRDNLPARVRLPMGLIVNTDKAGLPGQHWVAIYIDKNGYGEYFDSYGTPAVYTEFQNFMFDNAKAGIFQNMTTLQCLTCVTCGNYCVAYLMTRFGGGSYADFISLFTSNPDNNDILIKFYFNLIE